MQPLRWLAGQNYALITVATIIWAGNATAGRLAAGHISPFLLTSLRWLVATTLLIAIARPMLRRDWPVIRANLPYLAVMGAVGFMLFNNLFYLGLNYTTSINAAIIQAGTPLMVYLLNFMLFRLRSTSMQLLGFALTMVGVILTSTEGDLLRLSDMHINIGDAYVLAGSFAYGAYTAYLVRKPDDLHWLSLVAVFAFFALLSSLPFTAWEFGTGKLLPPDAMGWGVVIYAATLPAILAQVLWIRGLESLGSNRGGIFMNLVPIFTAGMAVLLLGETFHFYHAVALVLVVGGVWISQRNKKTPARAAGVKD